MRSTPSRHLRRLAAIATPVAGVLLIASAPASAAQNAAQDWAPADSAAIHPGVMTHTEDAQCTSNFIFTDGGNVYIGQAAHCASTSSSTTTNGCEAESLPLGTRVEIEGASNPGTLVYSSWQTMREVGETNSDACAYNDFALIQIDPADAGDVNPSIPHWGGPTGLNTAGTETGDTVLTYGNSSLRLGLDPLKPKQGTSVGDSGNGWSHNVYTVTPGIPGDSGSAFLDAQGRALGVLSTLQVAPNTGSNGVGDISRELAYMQEHSEFGDVQLVEGTESFSGPLLG